MPGILPGDDGHTDTPLPAHGTIRPWVAPPKILPGHGMNQCPDVSSTPGEWSGSRGRRLENLLIARPLCRPRSVVEPEYSLSERSGDARQPGEATARTMRASRSCFVAPGGEHASPPSIRRSRENRARAISKRTVLTDRCRVLALYHTTGWRVSIAQRPPSLDLSHAVSRRVDAPLSPVIDMMANASSARGQTIWRIESNRPTPG